MFYDRGEPPYLSLWPGVPDGGGGGDRNTALPPICFATSRANNPNTGRNILAGGVAGAGIAGALYTTFALLNLEDGVGEVMLGLRVAMLARNSATTLATSQILEGVASAGGTVDAAYAAANGAGVGFAAGAAAGLSLSSSMCAGY